MVPTTHVGSITPYGKYSPHCLWEAGLYLISSSILQTVSYLATFSGVVCQLLPGPTAGECRLLSEVCARSAHVSFLQAFNNSRWHETMPAEMSWKVNADLLHQIPTHSAEDRKLVQFLQRRWLAKSTGFYSALIHWICPCFGIRFQVHPETTNSYARDPLNKCSETYLNRVNALKHTLGQPENFSLILTRPYNLAEYLPHYVAVFEGEELQDTGHKIALKMSNNATNLVLDLTALSLQNWKRYQTQLMKMCEKQGLPLNRIICIQHFQEESIGFIRLLPLTEEETENHYAYLLKWVSKCGLTANRVELDRCGWDQEYALKEVEIKQEQHFQLDLEDFEKKWVCSAGEKDILVKGTLQLLKGLLARISPLESPTKRLITQMSLLKIQEELKTLIEFQETDTFYETASHVEQIQSHLSALLEIYSPYEKREFSSIYAQVLGFIPSELKALASYGIHSSGMTNLTGIFKAVEKSVEHFPFVLYGENVYFENVILAEMTSEVSPINQATQEDFENVDLILAQFNPVLRRIDFEVAEYKVENIADYLHKTLSSKREKPLTLALDCTLDYLHSEKVRELLEEFEEAVLKGHLNIICYRSGLKFDLFGMDNYCGAPFYMIHNQEAKWDIFNAVMNDPVLQADHLSINWFCLAYQYATEHLENYRKCIFNNTRAFLDSIPPNLSHNKNQPYYVVPMQSDAESAFVDVKIFGPLHTWRASLLSGFLTWKCMEQKHPLFYRPSLGFYHPNLSILFSDTCSTIRLTLGLDSSQVDLLVDCFKRIDSL